MLGAGRIYFGSDGCARHLGPQKEKGCIKRSTYEYSVLQILVALVFFGPSGFSQTQSMTGASAG